jgi:hypothetical protein
MICRTLDEFVAKPNDVAPKSAFLAEPDITSFSKRLKDIADHLKTMDLSKKDKDHKRLI